MKEQTFLEIHTEGLETLGFWREEYRQTIIHSIERTYKSEILQYWGISNIVDNGDMFLVKWYKRLIPLTDKQVKENYGK